MQRKTDENYDDIVKVEEYRCDDADVIVFAVGSVARSAKEAVDTARENGRRLGLMKPLTIWPFPDRHIARYHGKIKGMLVAEMNLGQMINEVSRAAAGRFAVKGLFRMDSEPITPSQIVTEAENVL